MNPMSLLTKGRTFIGFKDGSSVYKLSNKGALPNFSAGRKVSPTPSHPRPEVSQSTLFDPPRAPASAPVVTPAPAPAAAPAPRPLASAPHPAWGRTVWNRLAGLCREFLRQWTARRKSSPFQGRTVQTELELNRVTVMRNDLLEDDMEVVRVGKKVKPAQHDQCQALTTDQ